MKVRILVLPLAAAVISGMVWYKLTQEYHGGNTNSIVSIARSPPPAFEALDKDNSITRLRTFLGRHNLFVVFFDGDSGAGADKTLQHLREHADELSAADYHVIGISSALPQHNRTTDFPQMFHLLTDPAPVWKIHRDWGSFNSTTDRPIQAVFHIDRAGNVSMKNGMPLPMKQPGIEIDALLGLPHGHGTNPHL